MDNELETTLRSLRCFCLNPRDKKMIRRHIFNFVHDQPADDVRDAAADRQMEEHMAQTLHDFQPAREIRLTAEERSRNRGELSTFIRAFPPSESEALIDALSELGNMELPVMDKLEVRASLLASMQDVPADAVQEHSPEPVRACESPVETGFVSIFSSMLCHRSPVMA